MDKFLIFTITGLSTAAIYAVAASGLVLTYTTTGIFNFAHGAIGMICAFAYWQVHFDWGWSTWLSLVVVIGLSLGGTTGYAINPARDLAPRFAHFLLPIPGKRDSDWSYSWIPVVGPILGGIVAALAADAVVTNYLMTM